jgi:hypothetical protein
MSEPDSSRPARVSESASSRILSAIDTFLADPAGAEGAIDATTAELPQEILDNVAAVEKLKSYRDGVLIQLAFGLEHGHGFDHTLRPEGARTAAGRVGGGFAERHIPGVKDAYQNIGKNSVNLARGNEPAFDALLAWMNSSKIAQREALFRYLAARVARSARAVLAMPNLRISSLTFAAVARFLDELVQIPSGGAFKQFAVAALLDALLYEFGLGGGVGGLRVVTKNINASDASAGTAADVQIMRANKVEEAFEVSANNWRSKVAQAVAAARNADLSRAHIIAAADGDDTNMGELDGAAADVTVTDVRSFLRIMTAALRKPAREHALRRFYELVDRNQPNHELTNEFVRLLSRLQLTAE